MIKRRLLVLFVIISVGAFAQHNESIVSGPGNFQIEIYYQIKCDGIILRAENFTLEKNNKFYYSSNGICNVDQKGYFLVRSKYENINEDSIYIQSDHQIDTIPFYKIHIERYSGIPPWPFYSCCGTPCNGEASENWDKGNVKIIGRFRNGEIIEMRTYNMNGIIEKKLRRSNHFSRVGYYDNGKLIFKMCEIGFLRVYKLWDQNKDRFHRRLSINKLNN